MTRQIVEASVRRNGPYLNGAGRDERIPYRTPEEVLSAYSPTELEAMQVGLETVRDTFISTERGYKGTVSIRHAAHAALEDHDLSPQLVADLTLSHVGKNEATNVYANIAQLAGEVALGFHRMSLAAAQY